MEELTPDEIIKKIEAYRAELAEKKADPLLAQQRPAISQSDDNGFCQINRNIGLDDLNYSFIVGPQ